MGLLVEEVEAFREKSKKLSSLFFFVSDFFSNDRKITQL